MLLEWESFFYEFDFHWNNIACLGLLELVVLAAFASANNARMLDRKQFNHNLELFVYILQYIRSFSSLQSIIFN